MRRWQRRDGCGVGRAVATRLASKVAVSREPTVRHAREFDAGTGWPPGAFGGGACTVEEWLKIGRAHV